MAVTKKDAEARRQDRLDRVGEGAVCKACGEADDRCLSVYTDERGDVDVLCYGCVVERRGLQPLEKHHPAGRHNDPTVIATPANDHRCLSDMQRDWPERTLRNPDESPLLRAAAAIRGVVDYLTLMIERIVGWIPAFLEWLDEALRNYHGEKWWVAIGWDGSSRA